MPLEWLRDMVLAGVDGEHRKPGTTGLSPWATWRPARSTGHWIRVPDTPANREACSGSAGTADDSSPFPQLRELRISAASTRAAFGVVTGPAGAGGARDKGEAEQVLLDKALKDYGYLFTSWRELWRSWIGPLPACRASRPCWPSRTHVLIRVRDGITLRRAGGLPARRLLPWPRRSPGSGMHADPSG